MSPTIDYRVQLIIARLEFDLNQPFDLVNLAHSVNLSESRLQHLFKEETDMTLGQCLRHLRLYKARELIETTCLCVKEVMRDVGYANQSHFTRDFRQFFGSTPLQHRKEHFEQLHANHNMLQTSNSSRRQ